ncbi:ankyrin repeat protein [Catovirus CTV1]|uniref:Ankyrin repeat protein n=1 Tax=Catovirus CTV1 TaxID=1977631 RepID=A0A1V0SC50_9VIRU|nr:ankyrin repeat protein [Catovirus CTV1]
MKDNEKYIFITDADQNIILEKDYLTELERTVLLNDLEKLNLLISRGETIYLENKICNGYLERKYKLCQHKCLKHICHKTALYYAFLVNFNILKQIYHFFKKDSDKYNDIIKYIENSLCGCDLTYSFQNYYSSSHFNLINISKKIIELMNIPEISTKNYVTNITGVECLYKINNICDDIDDIYHKYQINTKILKILLNQQYFEIFRYHLMNSSSENNSHNIVHEIYNDTMSNINYVNPHNNKTILTLTLSHIDNDNLVDILIEKGCIIPDNVNTVLKECLDLGFYKSVKTLIKKISSEQLFNPFCLFREILLNTKIIDFEKLEMIKIIEDKQNIKINDKLIFDILKSSISFKCLTLLLNNPNLHDAIDQNVITYCIQLKKHMELDLLLKYGRHNLVNGEDIHQIPIFVFFRETLSDNVDNLNILGTLLRFNPKLDILNTSNESPLIISTKQNRIESTQLLLSRGANPFLRDSNHDNCLHIAINNNYDQLVEVLSKYKSEGVYLVNEPTKQMTSCLTICLKSKNVSKYYKYLLHSEGINLNYIDSESKNVVYHVVSNKELSESIKEQLITMLLDKNINLKEICNNDRNILLTCIERDFFNIVRLIINKLVELKEITIDDIDIISALKNNKIKNHHLKNMYSPAISYLRQNMYKLTSKNVYVKNINIKNVLCVTYIFMIMFLILGIIEKKIIVKN